MFGIAYILWNVQNVPSYTPTSAKSENIYTNTEYGFRFTYPQGWHLGDNNFERGTFQLFNYSESEASGSVFPVGTNKIEARISANNTYGTSDDYPQKTRTVTEVNIAGQKATRMEVELIGGEKILSYTISLPQNNGEFLAITIYGDSSNFYVLEELIADIEWL